ncbi:unnamed protein product [Closterium sp. NIES-53]
MASSVALRQALTPTPFLTGAPTTRLSPSRASVSNGVSLCSFQVTSVQSQSRAIVCSAAGAEVTSAASTDNWVPVIPMEALPKGERRLIRQDGQEILLFWYRNEIYAVENVSPAEGAYSEGFLNARFTQRANTNFEVSSHSIPCPIYFFPHPSMLIKPGRFSSLKRLASPTPSLPSLPLSFLILQDGCIVCPSTDTTFDLKTGEIKEWYPKNPVLRALTKPLRGLEVFPVKLEDYQVCINMGRGSAGAAEVVVGEASRVGQTVSDVNVNEVRKMLHASFLPLSSSRFPLTLFAVNAPSLPPQTRMVVDESAGGFGFSPQNELLNGRAAMAGFVGLLVIELVTGKGLLSATGFLDFLYRVGGSGPAL